MPKKIKLDDKFYGYLKTGQYVREKLSNKRNCEGYRVKEVKPGRKILLCIVKDKKTGKTKTKAISLLRNVNLDLREYLKKDKRRIKEILKKARKLKKELTKKDK